MNVLIDVPSTKAEAFAEACYGAKDGIFGLWIENVVYSHLDYHLNLLDACKEAVKERFAGFTPDQVEEIKSELRDVCNQANNL